MRVVVTGAHGQLGQDVVKVFQSDASVTEVLGLGRNELDITDQARTLALMQDVQPDVIVHTAAYTAVDKAESEPELAYAINADGSRNVALAAAAVGAKLCAISTDYVFDGAGTLPYGEDAPTRPQTVYGKSKLAGERDIQAVLPHHFIVRTSWVFGAHGNNFVKTMLKLAASGKPLRVVSDQIGRPTYTKDLAAFLLQLVRTDAFGIVHASNAGTCSWYEFAAEIFLQAGLTVDLQPCTTLEFPRPAPRPAYSVLDLSAIERNQLSPLRPWREAVTECLRELGHAAGTETGGKST